MIRLPTGSPRSVTCFPYTTLFRSWVAVRHIVERSASPGVTVLRDYHAENIMLIDRAESHGLGLLDFQDALAGHPAYDLVSLLQDARRDVSPALEAAKIGRAHV